METDKLLSELFELYLNKSSLIPHDSRGLIAVSGGVDSVVLLHLLHNLSNRFNLKLGVAHYNHQIRGAEADKDEKFVRNIATTFGLPFYRESMPLLDSQSRESWEAYARRQRYAFLEKIRQDEKFDWIATAHHADDQTETILLRVIQGSGVEGLQGIREQVGAIIRPLLTFSKEQILLYSKEKDIKFKEDVTNRFLNHPRNYLRHQVIPLLQKLNPGLNKSIRRLTQNMEEMEDFTRTVISWCRSAVVEDQNSECIKLDKDLLASYPIYLQKRIIFNITAVENKVINMRHYVWQNLEQFLEKSTTGDTFFLPHGWTLLRDRKNYLLKRLKESKSYPDIVTFKIDNVDHSSVIAGEYLLSLDLMSESIYYSKDPRLEYVDFDKLSGEFFKLRLWQPGDRMKPLGLRGFKKVSDILIDHKVDRFKKANQYVLTVNNKVVWLCGVQLDDRYKVHKSTKRILQLGWLSLIKT